MKTFISSNADKCSVEDFNRVVEILKKNDFEITGMTHEKSLSMISSSILDSDPDFLIVMGGDGSIIKAVQETQGLLPIVGINFGKLGYLANFSIEDFEDCIHSIGFAVEDLGETTVSSRTLLDIFVSKNNENYIAVNDFVLDIGPPFRTISYSIDINSHPLSDVRGDGIIISTPTGSTAYNLSAGGSILQPDLGGLTITPKNPHRLSIRPIVVRDDSKIDIRVYSHEGAWAIIDGQTTIDLSCNYDSFVSVKKHENKMQLIKNPKVNYWKTLRDKLGWGI